MSNYREKKDCVCCGKSDLSLVLDLNKQPLANSYHKEDGSGGAMRINEDGDQGEGTALQWLSGGSTITETGNDSDQCVSGTLFIFDPSSTTYMKQFIAVSNDSEAADYSNSSHVSGIINTTSAIDEVQFKFSSGNVDSGVINMYGIL